MSSVSARVTLAGPVTQARVVRSEWTKLRSLRSTWWSAAITVTVMVGTGVAISLLSGAEPTSSAEPLVVAARTEIGTIFAQLVLGVLAVLLIAGEYGTGMIRSSMAVVPRRLPVLWGKLAVYVAAVFALGLVSSVATFVFGQVAWRSQGRPSVALTDPDVLRVVVGSALYLTVAGVMALAIGALFRSSAGGIAAVVGVFFVAPTVIAVMPARIAAVAPYLPSNAGGALTELATTAHPLAPWTGFAFLCGYTVILVAAAAWRLARADV